MSPAAWKLFTTSEQDPSSEPVTLNQIVEANAEFWTPDCEEARALDALEIHAEVDLGLGGAFGPYIVRRIR